MRKLVHCGIVGNRRDAILLKAIFFGAALTLALAVLPHRASAQEMSFRLVSIDIQGRCGDACPRVIAAQGEITNATPYAFLSFIESNVGQDNLRAVVLLDSPGGKVVASMELGKILRRIGAAAIVANVDPSGGNGTILAGRCLSACVYALMGAKKRVIPPDSIVGIHRMFTYVDTPVPDSWTDIHTKRYDNGEVAAVLSRYTGSMGVSPALITMAEHISSDQIHIMSRAEIKRFHLGSSRF